MPKTDLIQILLDHYHDRLVWGATAGEVQDIADYYGVSPREVSHAMNEALDEIEATKAARREQIQRYPAATKPFSKTGSIRGKE